MNKFFGSYVNDYMGVKMKDKPPSIPEWKELYSAAMEFKELKPWEWMYDSDIFGVQNPETDEIGFCCVMGRAGEHFAMSVYLGSEGLDGLLNILSGEIHFPEVLYSQKCLMASFEGRDYIEKPDYEIIRKLGLRFRGKSAWPLFRSYRPYYIPWYLNHEEAKFLTLSLKQAIKICKEVKKDQDILKPPLMTQIMVRTHDGQRWNTEWMEPWDLEEEVMVGYVNEDVRENLLKLPHKGIWEADSYPYPEPVQEDSEERPYFPCSIIWADHESGLLMDNTLVEPNKWVSSFLKAFQKITKNRGLLPQEIQVRKYEIYEVLEPVASELGMELSLIDELKVIDGATEYMEDLSMDGPVIQVFERMMEDKSFRDMVESGELMDTLARGEIPDIMNEESMEAFVKEFVTVIEDDVTKSNLKVSMQTTLFPDENYQEILDEKSQREFRDITRFADEEHERLFDGDFDDVKVKKELDKLIKKDPDFLYPYLTLVEILKKEGQISEANEVLEKAYVRALNLIIDESGRWPGKLEGCWIPNWHIIQTILEKAISLWEQDETDDALDLLRKLLKTNPNDEGGARNYILAICMNQDFHDFQEWVNDEDNHEDVLEWFEENYLKFPDEFSQWRKEVEQQH